jgi:2-dehydro-3-deoxy-D-gluconate 5-dehydrogenase
MNVLELFQLDGKVALVTGAARGIGGALANALAEAGADLACVDVLPSSGTIAAAAALGRRTYEEQIDLIRAAPAELDALVERVDQALGGLDILVNCAGIVLPNALLEINEADYDSEFALNQKALFFLSQAAGRRMAAAGSGKIINIASAWSFQGGEYVASYTGTKSAVAGYTRAFANEMAPKGVHVNAIAPGWTSTATTSEVEADNVLYQSKLERIPAGRWAVPDDYKGAVVFLASQASDFMHGVVIQVDGGWFVR